MATSTSHQDGKMNGEVFYPLPEVVAQANVPDPEAARREATQDLESYWARRANELEWYKKWDKVLDDSNKPFYRWFSGGELNTCYNALDRHVEAGRGDQTAHGDETLQRKALERVADELPVEVHDLSEMYREFAWAPETPEDRDVQAISEQATRSTPADEAEAVS